jgi:hypothetical protein
MLLEQHYKQTLSDFLHSFDFDLFATVSLGVPYSPKVLENRTRHALKRVTSTPYKCGFYGVYADQEATPHMHLLLGSAKEPLDMQLIQSRLALAFRHKNKPEKEPPPFEPGNDLDIAVNVERQFSSFVDVRPIDDLKGVIRYICGQYSDMHQRTENEIFGNINALMEKKIASGQVEPW